MTNGGGLGTEGGALALGPHLTRAEAFAEAFKVALTLATSLALPLACMRVAPLTRAVAEAVALALPHQSAAFATAFSETRSKNLPLAPTSTTVPYTMRFGGGLDRTSLPQIRRYIFPSGVRQISLGRMSQNQYCVPPENPEFQKPSLSIQHLDLFTIDFGSPLAICHDRTMSLAVEDAAEVATWGTSESLSTTTVPFCWAFGALVLVAFCACAGLEAFVMAVAFAEANTNMKSSPKITTKVTGAALLHCLAIKSPPR